MPASPVSDPESRPESRPDSRPASRPDSRLGSRPGSRPDSVTRPDRYAWKALAGSAVGYAMDGFDLLILGFMLPAITKDLGLSPAQAGSLVTWTLVGAVVGGLVFGPLSDRFGRIRVLTWTIVLFAVFTGLCALARDYTDLLVYRTIAGIGLGGEFGIGMALVAEAWPASHRARASSYVALGWQVGVLLAALLTPLLIGHIGWRGMFLVGLAPALAAFVIRARLHEPEPFVRLERDRAAEPWHVALGRSLRLLVVDRRTARTSLGIAILCSVQNFGYYGLMIWMPTYLSNRFGFGLTKSAAWTAVTVLGMMAGIWVFGQLADRIGRKASFLAFQTGAALMVLYYAQISDATTMLWAGAVLGMFVNGMLGGYGALMSEAYPTGSRATAQNVLFNVGRAVGGFGPAVIGGLAASTSFPVAIALLAGIYVIDAIATIVLVPELRGAPLPEAAARPHPAGPAPHATR